MIKYENKFIKKALNSGSQETRHKRNIKLF